MTDSGTRRLVTVDVADARVVGSVRLEEWPRHVAIDATGRNAWVGLGSASQHVAIVDPHRAHPRQMVQPELVDDDGLGLDP